MEEHAERATRIGATGAVGDPSPRDAAAQPGPRHLPALDGLRAIAVLCVLANHTVGQLPVEGPTRIPAALAHLGWLGVDLFFVLSGWLITGILLEERGSEHALRRFYARRALRILPLYLLVISVQTVMAYRWAHWLPLEAAAFRDAAPWLWTHTVNFHFANPDLAYRNPYGISPFWSLGVEEQFYAVWPLLVLACPLRRLPAVCFAVAAGSALLRAGVLAAGAAPVTTYMLPFTHLDGLALGAALAAVVRLEPGGAQRLGAWARALAEQPRRLAIAALALGALVTTVDRTADPGRASTQILAITLGGVLAGGAVLAAALGPATSTLARVLGAAPLRIVGRISYGLYLLHAPMLYLADILFDAWWPTRDRITQMIAGLLLTVVAATLSWHAWERPWLALKRFVPRAAGPRGASAVLR